ncbi:alpha/beta fold hydrolase [Betaproteobacteria bacterium]|nr:alpha/beta fold hydrolase [Betaproteobacteria bacterium]
MINIIKFVIDQSNKKVLLKSVVTLFGVASLIVLLGYCIKNLLSEENLLFTTSEYLEETPVTITGKTVPSGKLVILAHGFAGSTEFMRALAVALATDGHIVIRFDFLGHGKNKIPFSGDVKSKNGPTKQFVNQLNQVINGYKERYNSSKVVLIGHSMASDIIIRATQERDDIESVIAISSYTDEIPKNDFPNLLVMNGEWEKGLTNKTLDLFNKIGINNPKVDKIYGEFLSNNARKLIVIPGADHVGILYAKKTQLEILNWISSSKEKFENKTNAIGTWALGVFGNLFLLPLLLSTLLKKNKKENFSISIVRYLVFCFVTIIFLPLILTKFSVEILSFPVHNHIFNTFLFTIFIWVSISPVIMKERWLHALNLKLFGCLTAYYLFGLGFILNYYVSTYYVSVGRVEIFLVLLTVTIPTCIIIQVLYEASNRGVMLANLFKATIVCSLIFSIYLYPSDLFLLAYAVLLFVAFFFVFGFLSNIINNRVRSFVSIGMVNGVILSMTFSSALPLYLP